MPCVYLNDDEVVDLILERPHLIQEAFAKMQKQLDEAESLSSTAINSIGKLRRRIKELEKGLDVS